MPDTPGDTRGTILLIEDAEGFREVYRDVLASEGYYVLEAADGLTGVELAMDRRPALILLDLVLPKLHGFQILEQIRADVATKAIPIIVLSVLGEQESVQRAMELGANDYTIKGSVSPREILSKISSLIAAAGVEDQMTRYRLTMTGVVADTSQLEHDIGLTRLFKCPDCGCTIVMELLPDETRSPGHWFSAHFMCSGCGKDW